MADKVRVVGQGSPASLSGEDRNTWDSNGTYHANVPGLLGANFGASKNFDSSAWNVQNLDQKKAFTDLQRQEYEKRRAYTASNVFIDQGADGQTRAQQNGLIDALTAQGNGQGPSVAQMQLQRGTDQSLANAMALGASQRGAGGAAALRNIGYQQGAIAQQGAADAAMLRMNEQMQARNQLGAVLAGVRGQDQNMALNQAQLNQQTVLANQQAGNNQTALNDKMAGFYQTLNMGLDDQQLAARQAREQLANQWELGMRGVAVQNNSAAMQTAGAGLGALGAAFAFSDERLKTDVKPASEKFGAFLDSLGAHQYRYKNEKHGKGERFSVMAQELEKSEIGKTFVRETSEGKAVDYGSGLGAMLAGLATVHKRVKALEGGKKDESDE